MNASLKNERTTQQHNHVLPIFSYIGPSSFDIEV